MRDIVRETYYRRRAPVYDVTSYRGDPDVDAGLDRESAEIGRLLEELPGGRVLDVGCGTATWTRSLPGTVVAMDQSHEMLALARRRVPQALLVHALFPAFPFPDESFDLLFTGNFYGLLRPTERRLFLADARRMAKELVVLDLRSDHDRPTEGVEIRDIGDGRTYPIFRRRFTPGSLLAELGGDLIYPGRYFLVVRTRTAHLPEIR